MLTAFFVTAAAGRVGIAMTNVALLWFVLGRTGSFGSAGALGAGLAVAEALVAPQTGRIVDRCGQCRVLPPLAGLHATTVVVALVGVGPGANRVTLVGLGCLLGATLPQLGALSAARWAHRFPPGPESSRAVGWEANANSAAYLSGPALALALAGSGHSRAAVVTAGALVVGSTLLLGFQRGSAPPGHRPAPSERTALPHGVGLPIAVNVAVGIHFGAMPLAVAAALDAAGRQDVAPCMVAASGGGGLLAGLGFAALRWRAPGRRQLRVTATVFGLAALPLLLPLPLPALVAVLVLVGAAVPPVLVTTTVLARERALAGRLTSTFSWLASCSAAGSAASAALTGALVDGVGPAAAFALAAGAAVGVAVIGRTGR